ncbi:hypothetical protein GCM10011504_41500 [Siccirubricoccus deserti]|nr:hypothetical protein GCM10011504_41500 [Siccirubricoccus deserti]
MPEGRLSPPDFPCSGANALWTGQGLGLWRTDSQKSKEYLSLREFPSPGSGLTKLLPIRGARPGEWGLGKAAPSQPNAYPARFASIASQIALSRCTPSKRAISCSPVGLVTLISVR